MSTVLLASPLMALSCFPFGAIVPEGHSPLVFELAFYTNHKIFYLKEVVNGSSSLTMDGFFIYSLIRDVCHVRNNKKH
jgi:hypothetical protein